LACAHRPLLQIAGDGHREAGDDEERQVDPVRELFPAVSATIELAPSSKSCEELWVWASDAEPVPDVFQESGTFGRVTAIDVDGEPILISTWATSRSDEWIPQADALIASVDFQPESNQAPESPAGS
jgi:hypothetical protein